MHNTYGRVKHRPRIQSEIIRDAGRTKIIFVFKFEIALNLTIFSNNCRLLYK